MIGIVVVSHSFALGTAAADLAAQMVPEAARPALRVAAGLDETTFGTDAAAIAEAITAVDSGDGVLVLVDLGSAILSAEMALEFIDPAVAHRTVVSPAPLIEGLVAALVTASTGASLAEASTEAAAGLLGKQEQLVVEDVSETGQNLATEGTASPASPVGTASPASPNSLSGLSGSSGSTGSANPSDSSSSPSPTVFSWTIRNPNGLHARPAANFVAGLRGLDATLEVSNATTGRGPVPASSLTKIQTLGLRRSDQLVVRISGPDADMAYARLVELSQTDFGETVETTAGAKGTADSTQPSAGESSATPAGNTAAIPPASTGVSLADQSTSADSTGSPSSSPSDNTNIGKPLSPAEQASSADYPTREDNPVRLAGPQEPLIDVPSALMGDTKYLVNSMVKGWQPGKAGENQRFPHGEAARTGRQIAIGIAHHLLINPDLSAYLAGDQAAEQSRLEQAIGQVTDILHQLGRNDQQGIYIVQELLLDDARAALGEALAEGVSAVEAVRDHFQAMAAEFEALDDPYLRARAEDQRGLQRMLLRALTGQEISPSLASGILILEELDPLTAGSVDPELCQGIITTSGGATGHGAILAGARGIALLTGKAEAAAIPEGTTVAIDPVTGRLWIDPSAAELAELNRQQTSRATEAAEAARLAHDVAVTQTGARILVEANISSVTEAQDAAAAGAEGSGLVRTEVLFGNWDHAPTVDEQAEAYIRIGQALGRQMITVRTWDPGGDKPLAFLPQNPETNPMLGERGIRAMQRLPELLDTQLTAILLASKEIRIRVMFPMITLPTEMAWARSRLAALQQGYDNLCAGMMVETPAAALRARDFLDLADFISVGTNDLTQYTLAVDRGNPTVAAIAKDNSAVWDLIAQAARTFSGKPVAVCGDFASNPESAARLVHLGVTELSVRPPLIGVIKQAVRTV